MNLRTRLALLLGALAAITGVAVGIAGYRVTENRFEGELRESLDDYARELEQPGDAQTERACGDFTGVLVEPPRRAPRRRGRLGGQPPGLIIQCLDADATVTHSNPFVNLPIDAADVELASASLSSASRARDVTVDERSYRVVTVHRENGGAIQIARETTENDRVLSSLTRRYAVVVLGAAGAAALAGLLVARRVARPISELTATAELIATDRNLDRPLPEARRKDETGRLVGAFGSMVDALRVSKAQQAALVHDAGHELRTPLTSLRTNIGVLHRHPGLADAQRTQIVDDLHAELAELTDLVDELVALGADATLDDPIERVDLAVQLEPLCERWARRAGRVVTCEVATGLAVDARPRLLTRAVGNLVSNAVKFASSGPVEVRVARSTTQPSMVDITVRDHGPGFVDADLPHVFDRFFRSTVHRGGAGSGLGLAMVSQIAADHGGRVSASNAPGGGGLVTLSLPSGV